MNPYEVLGVPSDATPEDIKAAYRKMAKVHHPDQGGDPAEFAKVREAYDYLSDEAKRAKYDKTGQYEDENAIREQIQIADIVNSAFSEAIGLAGNNFEDIDLAASMVSIITNRITQCRVQIDDTEQNLEKLRRIKKRIKYTGDALDVIGQSLMNTERAYSGQIQMMKEQIELHTKAMAAAREYTWRVRTMSEMLGVMSGYVDPPPFRSTTMF